MRDGRHAVVARVTPSGDDDRVLFDDGSEKCITAWDIEEIIGSEAGIRSWGQDRSLATDTKPEKP